MAFYRTVTIAHGEVPSNQTNFPFGFIGTFAYLATVANGGKVQNANGYDIYFSSDSGGNNVLNFERVHWNAANGICEFWVQIPTLSSSVDTVIYLQYGNNTITTDQSDPTGTWDSNYVGVYHFGDGTTLNVNDSTGNANNGTNNGGTASNTGLNGAGIGSGGPAGSIALNGSSYVDLGTGSSLDISGNITLEAWTISTGGGTDRVIVARLDAVPNGYFFENNSSGADGDLDLCNAGTVKNVSGRSVTLTNWTNFVATYDGTSMRFYTDATLDATTSASGALAGSTAHAIIGSDPRSLPSNSFTGQIDEVRISKINRSADWITTSYNNITGSFATVGSEQTSATPINENLNDTLTLSDSVQEFMSLGFSPSDTQASNWGDAVSFNLQIPGIAFNENQATNWGDAIALEMDFNGIFTDGFTLSDFQQPASSMDAFADAISLSDAFSTLVSIQIPLTDSFTWTDSTIVTANVLIAKSDTFTFSDAVSFYIPLFVMFTDFFIWRDGQTVAWSSVLPPLSDTLTLSDSVSVNNAPFWTPVSRSLSDQLSLNAVILLQSLVALSLSDDFAFSDQTTVQDTYYPFNQLLIDSFTFNDSTLIIVEGDLLQFADTLVLSDSVLVANTTNFNNYIRRYLNDEPT